MTLHEFLKHIRQYDWVWFAQEPDHPILTMLERHKTELEQATSEPKIEATLARHSREYQLAILSRTIEVARCVDEDPFATTASPSTDGRQLSAQLMRNVRRAHTLLTNLENLAQNVQGGVVLLEALMNLGIAVSKSSVAGQGKADLGAIRETLAALEQDGVEPSSLYLGEGLEFLAGRVETPEEQALLDEIRRDVKETEAKLNKLLASVASPGAAPSGLGPAENASAGAA